MLITFTSLAAGNDGEGITGSRPNRRRQEFRSCPSRQLLDSNAFNPEEVTILRDVFEDTLRALKLTDRSDPVTSLIAKKIINSRA